jgi:hypothetical protein
MSHLRYELTLGPTGLRITFPASMSGDGDSLRILLAGPIKAKFLPPSSYGEALR